MGKHWKKARLYCHISSNPAEMLKRMHVLLPSAVASTGCSSPHWDDFNSPSNQSKTSMKDRKDYSHRTGLIGRIVLTLYIQEEFPQGKRETGKAQAGMYYPEDHWWHRT